MEINIKTYGCTRNRADGAIIEDLIESNGYTLNQEGEIVVLNTCAVKGRTINRMRSKIKKLVNNGKKVIVAGCLPSIDQDAIHSDVKAIIDVNNLDKITEVIRKVIEQDLNKPIKHISESKYPNESICKLDYPGTYSEGTTTIVPIAEGCLGSCSFCATKFARGTLNSYKLTKIVGKVKKLVNQGYKEIQVTSEDTAAYGRDKDASLPNLLRKLTSIEEQFKIRVGMMNPDQALPYLEDLIDVYQSEKIYNFLHLPLQSGDNEILNLMNRNYNVEEFKKVVTKFRNRFPDLYLSTDIIVGFPRETDEKFQKSIDVIKDIEPNNVNVSRFFPQKGTKAYEIDDRVSSETMKKRSKRLSSLRLQISRGLNEELVGKEYKVLVTKEGKKGKGNYIARLPNYTPIIVDEDKIGEFLYKEAVEAEDTYLMAFE